MQYSAVYSKQSEKDLQRLDFGIAKRIIQKIDYYLESGDPLKYSKPLRNIDFGQYRFRVGKYRVLFDKDEQKDIVILQILRIKHRKDVYM